MGAFDHLPYRPGVGIMLLNREGLVFVAKRLDTLAEAWQMPQGGIDEGEDARSAALRELEEEISLRLSQADILAETPDWRTYDLPEALVPKIWKGQYRGQKQKWFVMRHAGADTAINIHTSHPEFVDWKWVPVQQLPDIIVPFKRDLYQQLATEFGHLTVL